MGNVKEGMKKRKDKQEKERERDADTLSNSQRKENVATKRRASEIFFFLTISQWSQKGEEKPPQQFSVFSSNQFDQRRR